MHDAVYLFRDSGLRIGEVVAVLVVDDRLRRGARGGTIRATPKGGAVYTVALTPRTVAALRAHQERWPAGKRDRVFREPGKGRELVMPTRVRDLWARDTGRAGVPVAALA